MEVSETRTENSQQDKADNINIITDSNDNDDTPNINNNSKNPSYISDYNLFNGNNNYNNIFNNSYDSDTSNHSYHSVKTPHPYHKSRSSTDNIFLLNNEFNEFNEIKNGLEDQKQDINNSINHSNTNNLNHYSSFSPLRQKIVQKTRYSGKNLSHFNISNFKNNNANHNNNINNVPQNINNGKSNFSTFIRCNSTNINNNPANFFIAISNSFSSQNNNNNNILNSPIVNHNNSNLNVLNTSSNSFSLNQGVDKEFFTPQYHKKQKKKSLDIPRNKIHLESILRQKDKRTTIMIRHIPNKYTLKLFNDEINKSFANKYDLLYLPVDTDNHCNLGFGFINFVDPIHIIDFYDRYFGKKWEKFNSDKICELAYAKVQGKEELLKHIVQGGVTNCYDMPVYLTYDIKIDKNNSSIELPIKYLQAFLNFYPYSLYRIVSYDRFIVDSFYNF